MKTAVGSWLGNRARLVFGAMLAALTVSALMLVGCGGDKDDGGNPSGPNGGEKTTYKVTFNPNGGNVTPTSGTTDTSGRLSSLPTPARTGYTFDGWYTAATGGTKVTENRVYSANTTIYARWTADTADAYTVTFNANGGSGTAPATQTVNAGSSITLPSGSVLTRSGYTFDGWNTNNSGTGTNYSAGSSYSPTGNVTLYAKWNAESSVGGIPTPTKTPFTDDRDGKTYNKVTIGTQVWMAQNLNYDIPNVSTDVCYENSADSCAKYGRLFTWADAKAACPSGWHLPDTAEWTQLTDFVGGLSIAGTKLKSSTGWRSYSGVPTGTNDYGFSALPGGESTGGEGASAGIFYDAGRSGYWWSATEYYASDAWYRGMYYNEENVGRSSFSKTFLYSVRCVENGGGAVTTYTVTFNANGGSGTAPGVQTVNAGSSITLPSGSALTRNGYTFDGWNTNNSGTGTNYSAGSSYSPSGNVTLYAKWDAESGGDSTFTDSRDGQIYKKVEIGSQVWMAENLNRVTADSKCRGNSADSCEKYGRLYLWSDAKAACPAGWHLPSDAEWTQLTGFVGGASTAGTKLKSSTGWRSVDSVRVPVGTNEYGFSALPGGASRDGDFLNANDGYWWSATESDAANVWTRYIYWDKEEVNRAYYGKSYMFSVRCIEN